MSIRHVYGAFGLTVVSDVELPGMLPPRSDGRQVVVHVGAPVARTRTGTGPPAFSAGMERMWRSDAGWLLRYEGAHSRESWTMHVAVGGGAIDVERTAEIAIDDLIEVLKSVGLASALQLQDVLLLHGCVVEVAERAVLVLGASASGKSTTAAAFLRQRFALLSDDVAAVEPVDGALVVQPGPPRLRVTPDVARAMGWDPDALPRVFATPILGDKRQVALSVEDGSYCGEPRAIAAIFVLRRRTAGGAAIEPVSPGAALALLRGNGFRDALLDPAQHVRRFPLIARLAHEVPVLTVRASNDLAALPALVDSLAQAATL